MRKKTLKRLLSLTLVAALVAGMTACGQTDSPATEESKPEKKEESVAPGTSTDSGLETETADDSEITYPLDTDLTVSLFTTRVKAHSDYTSADESPFHSGLEKNVGVDIDWVFPGPDVGSSAALNILLTEPELPTIINHGFSLTMAREFLEDGLIWDLTEYIPKYAPDYWEFINQPEYQNALEYAQIDGKQWGILSFVEGDYNLFYQGPAVRKDWADECGINLDEVVTLEDWEEMLTIFKDKYGAKLVAPQFINTGTGSKAMLAAGLYFDNGELKLANTEPEWKEYLTVLNDWWEKDLIDKDSFTMDNTAKRTKVVNDQVSAIYCPMSQMTNYILDAEGTGAEWVGIEHPRTEKGATIVKLNDGYGTYWRSGVASVITKDATEEEMILALKVLNYGFTEEGIKYWNWGEEGVSYTVNAEGEIEWTDLVMNDEGGLSNAVLKYTGSDSCPISVQLTEYVQKKNNPVVAEANYKWIENHDSNKYPLPDVVLSEEENLQFSDGWAAIKTYVSEMALKFVTGEESLDNFDAFLKHLDELGLEKVIAAYQAAYDRQFVK